MLTFFSNICSVIYNTLGSIYYALGCIRRFLVVSALLLLMPVLFYGLNGFSDMSKVDAISTINSVITGTVPPIQPVQTAMKTSITVMPETRESELLSSETETTISPEINADPTLKTQVFSEEKVAPVEKSADTQISAWVQYLLGLFLFCIIWPVLLTPVLMHILREENSRYNAATVCLGALLGLGLNYFIQEWLGTSMICKQKNYYPVILAAAGGLYLFFMATWMSQLETLRTKR